MPGLALTDIPDLVNTTLPHFKSRGRFEAAFNLQNYYFLDEVFQQDRYDVQDGTQVEWTVVLAGNGSARHAGLYATRTNREQRDVVKLARGNWCFADAEAIYHSFELLANRGPSQKAKYIKTRYFAAYKDLADIIEQRAVLTPADASDQENPVGLPWWIRMANSGVTDYTGGFIGRRSRYADGTGTTTTGGIDSDAEALWRNWACNHAGMGIALCDSIRRGMTYTNFRPPRNVKEMYTGPSRKLRILSSLAYQIEYSRLVNNGPDNRNGDLSPFGVELNYSGIRWVGVPTLETAAYNPVYCVDFANFQPIVHSDMWLKELDPMNDRDQPHVFVQRIDCWYNYICVNPRQAGFVIHSPIP